MALTGQAKREYQREYMRRRRSNARSNRSNEGISPFVRPKIAARVKSVRPSNGSEWDDLRAASERLEAALGGPAIEPIFDGGNDAAACDYSDGCIEPETLAAIDAACGEPVQLPDSMLTPEPQSYNPMMVGYVPPKG